LPSAVPPGTLPANTTEPHAAPAQVLEAALEVDTPAFLLVDGVLRGSADAARRIATECGCRLLYALKALAVPHALASLAAHVDGFAASSLFEARLAREALAGGGTVHFTSPGLRPADVAALREDCDFVSFNSLSQLERFGPELAGSVRLGLRVNPQLSFVADGRYDPCRRHSKLGAPLAELVEASRARPDAFAGIDGIHFHSNCDATDLTPWFETVQYLCEKLDGLLAASAWVNLGGGYLLGSDTDVSGLREAVELLESRYGLDVFVEPGASLVRNAGYVVASVVDLFVSDGVHVACLDTSVNHMPEVFEYQYQPPVLATAPGGRFRYRLAGSTCLQGDEFGEYAFEEPLAIGSRIVFAEMGSYTLTKAHMFNGVALPALYALTEGNECRLLKRPAYRDFESLWSEEGSDAHH